MEDARARRTVLTNRKAGQDMYVVAAGAEASREVGDVSSRPPSSEIGPLRVDEEDPHTAFVPDLANSANSAQKRLRASSSTGAE
jgi:hypothetical protein